MNPNDEAALRLLLDKDEIRDVLCRYARGVDRGDMAAVRACYHPDATDDHIHYRGGVDGFIDWLGGRLAGYDNSMHFLGNCLIEFAGPDLALVETYYASRRLSVPDGAAAEDLAPDDRVTFQSWGRYLDRFERRVGEWRIADRRIVVEARFTSVATGGARHGDGNWGARDSSDPLYAARAAIFGAAAG
jgi:hypothetical protein